MHKYLLSLILSLALTFPVFSEIVIQKKVYHHPTPVLQAPRSKPIRLKHRLPLRPGLEHRRLYRRLGLLPEVFELC